MISNSTPDMDMFLRLFVCRVLSFVVKSPWRMFDALSKSGRTSVNKVWRPEQWEGLGCLTWSEIGLKIVISVRILVVLA